MKRRCAAGADQDEQILAAARELLGNADPDGVIAKQYNMDLRDAKGVRVGDHTTMHATLVGSGRVGSAGVVAAPGGGAAAGGGGVAVSAAPGRHGGR